MPNWCSTSIMFDGEIEEIKRFREELESIIKGPAKMANSFGDGWLGDIVIHYGYGWKEVPCRGEVSYIGDLEDQDNGFGNFMITTTTAHAPLIETWDLVISNYSEIDYVYIAEEPGCQVFINTDTEGVYFKERYRVDVEIPKEIFGKKHQYIVALQTEEELLILFKKITGQEFESHDQIEKYFENKIDSYEGDEWFGVNISVFDYK